MSIFLVRAWSIRLWGHPESFQTYAPPSTTPYFTDISTSDFAFPYMQKMKELTITAGCGGTTFCPDNTLTNFDSTILTVRARQVSDVGCTNNCTPDVFPFTASPADFTDLPVSTNPPFKWAQRAVTLGVYSPAVALPNCPTVGNFCQTAPVSRGQMALLVQSGVLGQTTPTVGAVIPNGITSIADTMMFVTTMAATASYASVIIENSGTYATNTSVIATNACYVQYNASSNGLFLGTDALSQSNYWVNYPSGPWTPGAQGQVSNSRCTLDLTRSYVQTSGNQLTLHLALTFQPSWSGVKEMYFAAGDASGSTLDWTNRGNWTVPAFSQVPVTTDHYDVFRTGATVHETKLTPQNVNQTQFGIVGRLPITACAWAQPLYVPGVTINGVTKNVLYVATADATISAFDADTVGTASTALWTRSLGSTPGNFGDGDIVNCATSSGAQGNGPAGIVGTPAIDLSSNTMYVVGNVTAGGTTVHKLFAINIANGLDTISAVTVTDPAGTFVSPSQNQRSGLLLAEYNIIIPYASYYDHPDWHGWVFNYNTGNLGRQDSWNYSPNWDGASIWMSGGGAAFDGNRVYVTTGNNYDEDVRGLPPLGLSNSLLQVNPYGRGGVGLGQVNQFLPPQASSWYHTDRDLGSSRAILLPGTNYIATGGKAGNIYILDRTAPITGPVNPTATTKTGGSLRATFNVTGGGVEQSSYQIMAGFAYWNGTLYSWAGTDTLTGCSGDSLRSFPVAQAVAAGTLQASPGFGYVSCEQGAPLSISANYDVSGILWAVLPSDNEHNQLHAVVGGHLYAFDAGTLGQLYVSDLGGDGIAKFTAPVVANGKVYVVTSSHEVLIYGLGGH